MKSVGTANHGTANTEGLPVGWRWSTLGELAQVNPARTNPESDEASVSFLAMGDVSEDGRIRTRQTRSYRDVAKGFTSFIDDDVLVAKITPCFENGKGAHVAGLLNGLGFGSTEFHVVRARHELASPAFLHLHTRTEAFRRLGERSMLGSAGQKRVPAEFLRAYPVALPPMPEQARIVALLKSVDDKLDVIAHQIEATQTLKQGLMQTLFSRGVGTQDADGRWVPHAEFKDAEQGRVPAAWSVQTLEQVALVERGKFSARPRNDPKYFEGGDIPFVQTGDVAKSGRLISTASQFLNETGLRVSKLFEPGTIFLTIAANIGDVAIAAIPMACPDSVVGIRAVEGACDPAWLYYLLSANKGYFDSRATQNAQKNINLQVLRPFRFAMPPPAEQAQIGLVLTALDEKLESLGKRLHHHQTLKRGLMQKLLTGEWRVKADNAAHTLPVTEAA